MTLQHTVKSEMRAFLSGKTDDDQFEEEEYKEKDGGGGGGGGGVYSD